MRQGIIVLLLHVGMYPLDLFQNGRDVLGLACKVFTLSGELVETLHKTRNRVLEDLVWRRDRTTIEEEASVVLDNLLLFLYAIVDVVNGLPSVPLECFTNYCRWVVEEGVQDIMGYLGVWYPEDGRQVRLHRVVFTETRANALQEGAHAVVLRYGIVQDPASS